jgi:hypothetical protein
MPDEVDALHEERKVHWRRQRDPDMVRAIVSQQCQDRNIITTMLRRRVHATTSSRTDRIVHMRTTLR